jgi:hypothetical protein
MNKGPLSDASFIGSYKRSLIKKRGNPKKIQRGSKQKSSNEKRGNPKKRKGAQNKRPPMTKEATPKCKGIKTKDLQ